MHQRAEREQRTFRGIQPDVILLVDVKAGRNRAGSGRRACGRGGYRHRAQLPQPLLNHFHQREQIGRFHSLQHPGVIGMGLLEDTGFDVPEKQSSRNKRRYASRRFHISCQDTTSPDSVQGQ